MIRTTPRQLAEMQRAVHADNASRNEKVWTFLVATLLARPNTQPKLVERICGEPLSCGGLLDIWLEAQPLPPRKGNAGESEGNTKLDVVFGHVAPRGATAGGIAYGPHRPGSWVCFIEAKCLSDCSATVSYDPLRNQVARVMENLLCFQHDGHFPERLFFTLLTPRLLQRNESARLYGYKMCEYRNDPAAILRDIDTCCIEKRSDPGFVYPDLSERLNVLRINWIAYEVSLPETPSPWEGLPRACDHRRQHAPPRTLHARYSPSRGRARRGSDAARPDAAEWRQAVGGAKSDGQAARRSS